MPKNNQHIFKRSNPPIKNFRKVFNRTDLPALPSTLTKKERIFAHEYTYDWNATRAALAAGIAYNPRSAGVVGYEYLRRPKIQAYMKSVERNIEKLAGISRTMVLQEHMKIAFSSMAQFHDTWLTKKEFDELTDDQKACISEIDVHTKKIPTEEGTIIYVEKVKVKLYDKQKALEAISRMLGYDEPSEININNSGEIVHKHERTSNFLDDLSEQELNAIRKIGFKKLGITENASNN